MTPLWEALGSEGRTWVTRGWLGRGGGGVRVGGEETSFETKAGKNTALVLIRIRSVHSNVIHSITYMQIHIDKT